MLISVVLPMYNEQDFIKKAVAELNYIYRTV